MSSIEENELPTYKSANPIPDGNDSITPHLMVKTV
jgi:hypothetical protein